MDDEEDKGRGPRCRKVLGEGFGCWSGDVGKLVMVFCCNGQRMRVRRVAKMSLEDWPEDGKEVWPGMQPCRRADASCRRRTIGFAQC